MGRAEQADVGARGAIRADGPDFPVFEEPEKFDLNVHGKVADLVEKKRPTVRLHQRAGAMMRGARERAFDVTEEFAFGKRQGKRSAVKRHERARRPIAPSVEKSGDDFFASPGLSGDVERKRSRRGFLCHP